MNKSMQQSIVLCVGSSFPSRQLVKDWDNLHLSSSFSSFSSVCVTVAASEVILATLDDFSAIRDDIIQILNRYHKCSHLSFRYAFGLVISSLI